MTDRNDVLVEIGGKKYIPDSLESVCRWWMSTYPEDIFVENPKEVVEIRERMKKLLQQLEQPLPLSLLHREKGNIKNRKRRE